MALLIFLDSRYSRIKSSTLSRKQAIAFPIYRNKIMNNNIVSTVKNPVLDARPSGGKIPDYPLRASRYSSQTKGESISDLFGDFEHNFLEANLDKVISLEELKSIAEAIGKRDWGYVKYILTIICLILKSYQNISKHTDESILLKGRGSGLANEGAQGLLGKSGLKLIIPEKRKTYRKQSDSSKETKAFNPEEINNQLMNLNKIFKKMKNEEVQMNLSNCWSCRNNLCTIHKNESGLSSQMKFKEIGSVKKNGEEDKVGGNRFSLRTDRREG